MDLFFCRNIKNEAPGIPLASRLVLIKNCNVHDVTPAMAHTMFCINGPLTSLRHPTCPLRLVVKQLVCSLLTFVQNRTTMFSEDCIYKLSYPTAYTTLKTVTSTQLEGKYHMNLHSTQNPETIDLLNPWGKNVNVPSIKKGKWKTWKEITKSSIGIWTNDFRSSTSNNADPKQMDCPPKKSFILRIQDELSNALILACAISSTETLLERWWKSTCNAPA